jgi:hypothetical protein
MMALALVSLAAVSCNEPDLNPTVKLEVTPNNIAGEWKLVKFEGADLAPNSYVYLNLRRKDREFTEFQNIDNAYGTARTGVYNIYTDETHGAVIRGQYDYSAGTWNYRYKVTLYDDTMVWTAISDESVVCVYERCDIPAEIAALAPAEE